MDNHFAVLTFKEALIARGYDIKEKPEELRFHIVAERNGFAEFFYVEEDHTNVWNSREDFDLDAVDFQTLEWSREDSFWYVIVCRATKSFVIAHCSGIYKKDYLTNRDTYKLPSDKVFIVNYNDFTNADS